MRVRTFALLVPAVVLAGLAASAALGVNWIASCQTSHANNDDPIIFPSQPRASHTHLFVGASTTDAYSTYGSLIASPTTCVMTGDHSGYWEPKPLNYGLHPKLGALWYYNGSPTVSPFPDGLKMIVGNAHATSEATNPGIASGHIRFKCGPGSNIETSSPPASCGSGMLVTVVEFPNWWDGASLDSPDHLSHMSYRRDAAHPIELPRIKGYIRHAVPSGLPIDFSLSSGPYFTYHVDFFDGWVRSELQRFIDQCMRTGQNCGTNPS